MDDLVQDHRRTSGETSYSEWVGFIFIFNLIVGTGALTLPAVFVKAGWLLSLAVLSLLALMSYMTVTFIVETLAAANAVKTWQKLQIQKRSYYDTDSENMSTSERNALYFHNNHLDDEVTLVDEEMLLEEDELRTTLLPHTTSSPSFTQQSSLIYYHLEEKLELGEIAALFFNNFGCLMFYACLCIYLYGDLSIYSAAVAKSLRDLICDHHNTKNGSLYIDEQQIGALDGNDFLGENNSMLANCWSGGVGISSFYENWTRLDMYRLLLTLFMVLLGPFTAFSIQKTKYLQIITAICRWCAFILMITLATKFLLTQGAKGNPVAVNFGGLPSVFGACIYSFMCHHSLPSLLAPIRNKNRTVSEILRLDYIVIVLFYLLLALTGIFAFEHVEDLYTLNFIPERNNGTTEHSFSANLVIAIDYFLASFPIFTLSANFPIVAITLKNNLQFLFLDMSRYDSYGTVTRNLVFPLMVIVPPFLVTLYTENLTSLVAFTGSFAGAGIQYIIPITLVYYARITCRDLLGNGVVNRFQSPFRSTFWLLFVLLWSIACITLITTDLSIKSKDF